MCVFLCMGGNSTTWMNTAILVTCIRNFRRNRGPVSGILKGYVGLSTAIFTDLCSALFADNPATFVMMLAVIPLVVCLTAAVFLREIPPATSVADEKEESKYFSVFNAVAIVVAVYLLAYDFISSPSHALSLAFAIILLVLLASPLVVPAYAFVKSFYLNKADIERQVHEPLLGEETEGEIQQIPVSVEEAAEEVVEIKRKAVIGEDHTIFEAMRSVDFWVLFVSFLCGVGTGLAVMNNMGQIGLALGYADVSIFVSLTSIWGFFGRIASGSISEHYIK